MGFGSWLTHAIDVITPWRMPGEVQRSQQRKRRQDQQNSFGSYRAPGYSGGSQVFGNDQGQGQQLPRPQRPENLFAGLNQNLRIGQPKNNPTVVPNTNSRVIKPLTPGTVVQPTLKVTTAPAQNLNVGNVTIKRAPGMRTKPLPETPKPDNSFFGRVKRTVGTAGQTAVGAVANVPELGLAAGRAATGLAQGITQIPSLAVHAATYPARKLAGNRDLPIVHTLNSINRGVDQATAAVNRPFNFVNRNLDKAAQGYANHVSPAAGGLEVYKREQIPLNILAGLLTLGGAEAGQAGRAGEATSGGRFTRFINKPLTSNPENVVAKTGRAVSKRATPVVQPIFTPIRSTRAGVNRLINGRIVPVAERDLVDAGEVGNVLSNSQLDELTAPPTQIPVTQPQPIGVTARPGEPVTVPVRNLTPRGQPIRELGGDRPGAVRIPTADEAAAQRAANRFQNQEFPRPDDQIEGVTPRNTQPYQFSPAAAKGSQDSLIDEYAKFLKDVGEGNGVAITSDGRRVSNNMRFGDTGGKRMTKADWRVEAERQLREGKAETGIQKAFDEANNPDTQSLLATGDRTADQPVGRPITVKQANSIPVQDQTVVPTDLPETPGQVRPTAQTAPTQAKTEAVANAPVAARPAQLPAETQAILDNPKQFNKRQVAAARNQRKMAKQVAKAQEDTAAALERINTVSPAAQSGEGFVQTGELGKSANKGSYQKASRAAEMQQATQETANMSPGDVIQTARENQRETGGFTRRDIRNIAALFENKRIPRGTPEFNEAKAILKEDGTIWGQTGALRNYTVRRTATADELMGRYESKIYRLAEDPSKIDSKMFDDVEVAENAYADARDSALEAYNRFTENPTSSNAKVYHAAQDAAENADREAKMVEYRVANKVLKGNRDVKQARELQKLAQEADMYQMDAVDASMLSGTGTFSRNLVNAAVGHTEEGLFGKPAAWIARKLTGESVGGGVGRGLKKGASNVVDASKARAGNAGLNPLEHIKNWSTTGNQLGDTLIDSQVISNTRSHYKQLLKSQGYKGRELADRASVMARQDPDNVGKVYAGYARAAAGLGSGIAKSTKVESIIRDGISNFISFNHPNQASEVTAKLITRMTVGFPSAVGRTIVQGASRVMSPTVVFNPSFIKATLTKDPAERALLIKEGIKQAGSGAVVSGIFYGLGAKGFVTGSYPTDPEERARWQREGITENSIKIGGNWYQLPSYLGSAALPALFSASLGRNEGNVEQTVKDVAHGLPSILPTDQASNVLDWINGRSDSSKFLPQIAASAVRAVTPAGALLNQIAKSFDPTKNDTSSGTALENFVDKVLSGIPGENKFANIPDKVDDAGNPIQNPGALPLAVGAASAVQGKGEERSGQIQSQVDSTLKGLHDIGALSDPNLKAVLGNDDLALYNQALSGKKLEQGDVTKLEKALTKGVSETGDDTAYLEREQYDSNLTALKLKRQMMSADKSIKPSDLKKLDVSIKRGEIYKNDKTSYDLIDAYKSTSLTDWRQMGNPDSDSYDPEAYQKLWEIDQRLTKAGVSYKKGDLAKAKYSAKKPGKGRGGRYGARGGGSSLSSDFGTLKGSDFAPQVQAYQTIDQQSGTVPHIAVQRPNIVHKISSSG